MFLDDFLDIGLIDIAIPDPFGIDHHDWALGAPVQTARAVNSDLSFAVFLQCLDAFLGVGLDFSRATAGTALCAVIALIDAEKNMFFKIRHDRILL